MHQLKPQFDNAGIDLINNAEDIVIKADKEKLKQVFLNMILNSFDAISGKGKVEIYTICDNGGYVNVYIKDNGHGIDNPEKIFDPFYTTKNMGTGLGLAISQNIIEQHSGNLKIESTKPGETIFCISLPEIFTQNLKKQI
jgi:signal transduction histidine kinase